MLKKILLIQHKLPELKAIVQCKGEPELADKRRLHRSHKVMNATNVPRLMSRKMQP